MTQPYILTINTRILTGAGLPNGVAKITMSGTDVNAGVVLPTEVDVQLDAAGVGSTPCLASADGTQGTQIVVRFYNADGDRQGKTLKATMQAHDCNLHDILDLQPAPALSDAQAAENAAQGYSALAQNWATKTDAEVVAGQGYGAKKYAQDAAAAAGAATGVLTDPAFVAVHDDLSNIDAVAQRATEVDALGNRTTQLDALGARTTQLDDLGARANELDTLANGKANIDTVATNIGSVNTAATNIVAIQEAPAQAASAASSASQALAIFGDTATMNASVASAASSADTATAQAGLAQSYAASASSVVQQDLSGVTAAALHRSPNSVVAQAIYETWKDSDAGAWIDKATWQSWANEALNGPWLPATSPDGWQSELDARCYGATLGTEVDPDPTFASSVGWTLGSGASIASNTLTAASVATGVGIASRADAVGGNMALATAYQVTVVVATLTAGAILVRLGNTTTNLRTLASVGTYTFTVNPGAAGANLGLYASGTTSGTVTKFSIKPVTQQITATGSFFQKATDGKFYSLNAGSGTTEVFRGNTAKFPRLDPQVAEAGRLVIFAGDQVGRPMWKSLTASATNAIRGTTISSIASGNGWVLVGTNTGVTLLDFVKDCAINWGTGGRSRYLGNLAQANSGLGWIAEDSTKTIASNTVNAVAMTVLPDAPVDPVTGLQVPTIAVATNGGVSVVKSDGTVGNVTGQASAVQSVAFNARNEIVAGGAYANELGVYAIPTGTVSYTTGRYYVNSGVASGSPVKLLGNASSGVVVLNGSSVLAGRSNLGVTLLRENPATQNAGLDAFIASTYNTGWMVGDIRRCWLSSNVAESITATELVTNGTFNTDLTGWTLYPGATASVVAGAVQATAGPSSNRILSQAVATVAGKTYQVSFDRGVAGQTSIYISPANDGGLSLGSIPFSGATTGASTAFVATGATTYIAVVADSGSRSVTFDNVSVKEVIADRSYKNQPLTIHGTLAKTLIGGIAFYGGWSATNYADQAYSADLDPGTGSVYVPFAFTIPTNVAAVGWGYDRSAAAGASVKIGHDATGKITATISDGTTPRTVTTTNAYNTGLPVFGAVSYSPSGTVTIWIGGVPVATATGTPLGTLTNASATCTVGIDRGLTAPWAGQLALIKPGMTIATLEQARFAYEQEKFMVATGAVCTLPDSGAVVASSYGRMRDTLLATSAANASFFTGLVRTSVQAANSGSYTQCATESGVTLLARSTTNPGVDVTIPAYGLREELVNRAERAAALSRPLQCFDYDAVTSQTDFVLPVGYTALDVLSAGARKREGATKDWIRLYDGFRETIRFAVAPGNGVWVQISARRDA